MRKNVISNKNGGVDVQHCDNQNDGAKAAKRDRNDFQPRHDAFGA